MVIEVTCFIVDYRSSWVEG